MTTSVRAGSVLVGVLALGLVSPARASADAGVRGRVATATSGLSTFAGDHVPTLDELERTHILRVLELCEGQKTKAASMLGINRTTLWKKLRQYGIEGD